MTRLLHRAAIFQAIVMTVTMAAAAKIIPPKPVAPVEANGVRYSADPDGRDQYVVATDIATGNQLWQVKVFRTHIKFWIEEDVQWVFITNLKLMDNSLFVRDGKARCHAVDINSHRVRKTPCNPIFTNADLLSQHK